jgi:exopolysaccharide biosynthesis operon protein EpsL
LSPQTDDFGTAHGRAGRASEREVMRPPIRVVALITLLLSPAAQALWGDRLEIFVGEAVVRDDNVFRISGQSDPMAVLGTSSKGDVYHTTSFGLGLDLPVSRQRFHGAVSWDDHRYNRFSVLDFTDRHERAAWQWQAGSDLGGELGYSRELALASLANVQSGAQSSTPNPLETQRLFLEGGYRFTPRWELRGELSRLDQSNEVPQLQVNDMRLGAIGSTLRYITPADNKIGLGLQAQRADLPNPLVVGGVPVDNSYRQLGVQLVSDWAVTGKSSISGRIGWLDRRHEQLSGRDFSGGVYHVQYDWQARGKLGLSAVAQRQISDTEEVNVGFVLMEGIELRPTLALTEKIGLSGALARYDRDYRGDPGLVLGTVLPRSDRVRSAGLTVSYRPLPRAGLELALRRETRTSSAPLGDYDVTILGARLRVGF